jgi:tetratricopeptide (TPR) repeat protein
MRRLAAARRVKKALRLYDRGKYAESQEELRQALVLRPDLPEADQYHGILDLKQGRAAEALPRLRKAWEKNEDITVAVALGAAELLEGREEAARTWFQKALDAFPVLYDLDYHIGLAWLREKKGRKARVCFLRMLRREDEPLFIRLERLRNRCGI